MEDSGALKAIDRKRICLYTPPFAGDTTMMTTIRAAAEFGVGGVELMNFCRELKTSDFETVSFLAGEARKRGLEIPCLTVSIDFLPDPEGAVSVLKRYAKICAALGIGLLHHTIAKDFHCNTISDAEIESRFERCVPAVVEVAEFAGSAGIKTVTENQGFVFNGAERLLALREWTGGKIGFVADVGNIL
ncbi:MAG: TIM barrel protein, partial [Clostridia bacterium]|nr:TIM barrel protein [Clostridia bacterium]